MNEFIDFTVPKESFIPKFIVQKYDMHNQDAQGLEKYCRSSSDGEPGVFDSSVITYFFNVRAQFPNRTRTVPRHMLQYGRNKQQQLRLIHIHERIAMIIFFVLYKKQFNIMTFNGTIQC